MNDKTNIKLVKLILQNQVSSDTQLTKEIESYGRDVCVKHFKIMSDDGYLNATFENGKIIVHNMTQKGEDLLKVI